MTDIDNAAGVVVDEDHGYQIIVTNIKYKEPNGDETKSVKVKEKPSMTVLDVPEGILKTIKNEQKFKDNVETFAYNTLTKKYGAEVYFAQVWLPLDDEN